MSNIGKIVILKPSFMDKGDADRVFTIIEDKGDRFLVVDDTSALNIKPTFSIEQYMIEEIV